MLITRILSIKKPISLSAKFLLFLFFGVIFSFFPKDVEAQVVINEFYSATSNGDWVELYNNSEQAIDLSEYNLIDGSSSGNKKTFSCILAPKGFWVVNWDDNLNNAGDIIKLRKGEEVIDCVSYGNGQKCEDRGSVDLERLNEGEFAARTSDGVGEWIKVNISTKGGPNSGEPRDLLASCFTPTPLPTFTITPTSQPTTVPATATSLPTPTLSPRPTVTPTKIPTITPTKTPPNTPTATPTSVVEPTGEVLGQESVNTLSLTPSQSLPEVATQSETFSSSSKWQKILPVVAIVLGLGLIGVAGFLWWKQKREVLSSFN